MRVRLIAEGSPSKLQRDIQMDGVPSREVRIRFSNTLVLLPTAILWDVTLDMYVVPVYHQDDKVLIAHGFYTPKPVD